MTHLRFLAAVAGLAVLIAAAVFVPVPAPKPGQIELPVTRILACPAGNPQLGKTLIRVTDQTPFTAGPLNTAPAPATQARFEDPESVITVKGSATVGGIASYTERGRAMVAPCAPPTTSGTWNGIPLDKQSSILILTNADASPAVVDIFIYGFTGPLPGPGLRSVTLPPGDTQMLSIDQLVAGVVPADSPLTTVTVQMRASRGRVLALMRTTGPQGYDWQLPQVMPDTDLIVAGIPAGDSACAVSVTNTDTEVTAVVNIEVLGENGPFPPLGFETIEVPPSKVVTVDITSSLGTQASAIHLKADHPVTAAVTLTGKDVAVISAQPPLNGAVVLPPVGGTLWMVNPATTAATVNVHIEDDKGVLQVTDIVVAPQSIASTDFPSQGVLVRVSSASSGLRTAIVLADSTLSVLPVTGGGTAASVDIPPRDPGLG